MHVLICALTAGKELLNVAQLDYLRLNQAFIWESGECAVEINSLLLCHLV